jgi:hypothetical protein
MEASVQNFMQLGGCADFLHSFIWSDLIWRWIQQRCKSRKQSATETLAMIRQAFGEDIMSRTQKVQTSRVKSALSQ